MSIQRRRFLGMTAGVGALPFAAGHGTQPRRDDDPQAPNIVLVLADDLGPGDVGAYGGRLRTPTMDRLAGSGVRCTAMYAGPTDTPARAELLTGRYGARYDLPASSRPDAPRGLPRGTDTLATLLRGHGYATGLFGQWRLGPRAGERPLDHGFEQFSGTLYGTDVSELDWYDGEDVTEPSFEPATATRRITERAAAFVGTRRRDPFLAVVAPLVPHAPYRAGKEFVGHSKVNAYGDVVEEFDHHLDRLLDRVRDDGRPTLVIVTSDNGPRYEGRTGGRRGRKAELFDGGVRVPFIASWLGGGRTVRDDRPRSLQDVTPSLCRLAGVRPPSGFDGSDASDLLADGTDARRGPVFLFYDRWLNAMRDGRWKFHVAFGEDQRAYMPQLFDVSVDRAEAYNVAKSHPALVKRLTTRLERERDSVISEDFQP